MIAELGFAKREVVEAAVELARRSGELTGEVLVNSGVITAEQLTRALAERHGLDYIDFSVFAPDMGAANLIDAGAAKRYSAVPVAFLNDRTLLVAMSDPANILAIDDISMMTRYDVHRAVATEEDVNAVIAHIDRVEHHVGIETETDEIDAAPAPVTDLEAPTEEAPVVRLVHSVIAAAIERGASDIHFDPTPGDMTVRYRIDGVMWDSTTIPRRMVAGAVSRIKIMADLDISEKRKPQDGRVSISLDKRVVDVRLVTLPTVEGESVVMRILEKNERVLSFEDLGMVGAPLERFESAIARPHGAVLVTGPTGSGKSTTLYSALDSIRSPEKTIITIEDPVEVRVEGVKQVQVNAEGRARLPRRSALDDARGPRRDHGRRDPRPGDRDDGDRIVAHRPPDPLDPAHERRRERSHPAGGDGHRAIPRGVVDHVRGRAAAGARTVRCLQGAREDLRRDAARERIRGDGRPGRFRPRRLRSLRVDGLPGPDWDVRGHADDAADPRARARSFGGGAHRAGGGEEGMRRLHLDGLDKVKAGQTSLAEVLRVTTAAA